MRSSTRNQETTVNMSLSRSGDMSMSSQQHSYSESRHQLSRIPTRLPQNMDHSKKDRHKPKKEIKLSRGVATNTLPATRYKWPSEPQNRVQFVKADYLVRIVIKGCLHVAFASTSNVMNGFHDTKWKGLHLTCAFRCHAENGSDTHSVHLRLCFHPLNAKGYVDADANVTCIQSFSPYP